jgi:hypothetical protein
MTVHCRLCLREVVVPLRMPTTLRQVIASFGAALEQGCPGCGAHGNDLMVGPAFVPPTRGYARANSLGAVRAD